MARIDRHRLARFFRLFHETSGNTIYVLTRSLGGAVFISALSHLRGYYNDNRTLVRSAWASWGPH